MHSTGFIVKGEINMDVTWLNIASLVFGLIAWILPIVNLAKHNKAGHRNWWLLCVTSLVACATSIYLQVLYSNLKYSD